MHARFVHGKRRMKKEKGEEEKEQEEDRGAVRDNNGPFVRWANPRTRSLQWTLLSTIH